MHELDDEIASQVREVAAEQGLDPDFAVTFVSLLVDQQILYPPVTSGLSPDAAARVQLSRFSDAMPKREDPTAEAPLDAI